MRLQAFLLALPLSLLAACVCEDYFCDDLACYTCDGISCREVEPPNRPTCRGDFECRAGTVCTAFGCVETCDASAMAQPECPEGTVCREGENLCLGPAEETPARVSGACTGPDDCLASGLICLDGFCAVDPNVCQSTADCAAGELCVSGRCETPSDLCQFTFECETGLACVNSRCAESCRTVGCDAGFVCVDDFCQEDQTPGECVKNSECAPGQICINTSCVAECTVGQAGDCAADEYCDDGRCRFDDRPEPPFCSDNSDCAVGRRCVDGVCRTPCDTSPECLRFDVQFNVCANNLCVTTNEATSNCELQQDCSAGQSCVDGNCQ